MILVIDVGNTNIVIGVFENDDIRNIWRLATNKERTSDEFGNFYITMFNNAGIDFKDIEAVIISSVVPNIMYSLEHSIRTYFDKTPMIVKPGVKTGLQIKIDNPKELGSDILVNGVAAIKKYGGPVIIVDFGTATTLSAVNSKKQHLGVVICPGIKTASDALISKAAQLTKVFIEKPKTVIGKNSADSIKSGLVFGYVGKINYLVNEMKNEMVESGEIREDIKVIATGGLAYLISNETKEIDAIDKYLTLEGIKIIYEKNI